MGNEYVHKLDKIYFWDYLVCLILPLTTLLLLPFLSIELLVKFIYFLGMGYGLLIISPYNHRIDITKINIYIGCTSLLIFAIGIYLHFTNEFIGINNQNSVPILFYPLTVYIALHVCRQSIKLVTGTYPITFDRNLRPGKFSYRYKRKITVWDYVWTVAWIFGSVLLLKFMLDMGRIPK